MSCYLPDSSRCQRKYTWLEGVPAEKLRVFLSEDPGNTEAMQIWKKLHADVELIKLGCVKTVKKQIGGFIGTYGKREFASEP